MQTIIFGNRRVPLQQDKQIAFRLAPVPAARCAENLLTARAVSVQKLRSKQALAGSTGHLSALASWKVEAGEGRTPVEEGFDTGAQEAQSTKAQLQQAS